MNTCISKLQDWLNIIKFMTVYKINVEKELGKKYFQKTRNEYITCLKINCVASTHDEIFCYHE